LLLLFKAAFLVIEQDHFLFIVFGLTPKARMLNIIPQSRLMFIVMVGLWCLMPLSTIFQLYCGGQFYWWRKPEYPPQEKPQACRKSLRNLIK
jgi:hypothetical protein